MNRSLPLDRTALERAAAPFGESRTLPASAYTSAEVYAWEQECFFEGSWVCIGRSSDLARTGDQQAVRIGKEAVLLVRDREGDLRGFFNTCRHRGHELLPCDAPPTNRRAIRCPYHSWTYRFDGSCQTAPGFAGRPDFDVADPDNALVPARVEEWGGWVFANCTAEAPSLRAHLGNLIEFLQEWEPERLWVGPAEQYEVAANWKVIVENYHECYHCSNIHPELCRVTPPDSGESFEPTGLVVGGSMDLRDHAQTMSLTGESLGVPFRRLSQRRRREVQYLGLFPNLLISAHPDYVMTHRLEPRETGVTLVECQWLFPPEAGQVEGFDPSYAVEFWDLTNKQDWAACESVHRGAAGRGYRQGPLSDMEANVYQFIALVAQSYLQGRPAGPVPRWEPVAVAR